MLLGNRYLVESVSCDEEEFYRLTHLRLHNLEVCVCVCVCARTRAVLCTVLSKPIFLRLTLSYGQNFYVPSHLFLDVKKLIF